MRFFIRFMLISITLSSLYPDSKKHFTDQQVVNMILNYFYREHNSPSVKHEYMEKVMRNIYTWR